ncbi:MAG: L,D-transpeptidase/peptidoglycan binding protein [Actinomycetota bacterium]|nr:L,D-transpeptidase/peptidoglycan binding protein [Actinomycetota bacterium]
MPRRWLRRGLIALAVLVVLVGAAAFALVRYDHGHRNELLPGVSIGGVAAGGQDADQVASRIQARVPQVGAESVRVVAGPKEERLTLAQMGLRSDGARAVGRARADARRMGLPRRVWHRLLDKPVQRSYPVRLTVERDAIRRSLTGLAKQVDKPATDASIDTSTGFVSIKPAAEGRSLDVKTATEQVYRVAEKRANGASTVPTVAAPLVVSKPAVTGFADVILIRLGENKLYHYENARLAKTYTVATGTARYPTPKGRFSVVLKRRNPTWVNPDPSGWGASLPPRIGPGPGNPLGTRAMNLNAPGIRIHGTSNLASLGTSASHGCIRMAISDSEELFEKVDQGTPVVIIQGPPPPPKPLAPPPTPISTFGNPNAPIDLEAG